VAVLFISEAWSVGFKSEDRSKYVDEKGSLKKGLKDVEGRKECIVFTFETKLLSETITIEIDRSLGEPKLLEGQSRGMTEGGRFHELLTMPITNN
jgi:hypothetical protein